jgi:predicted hydrocarbon binding protein
MAAEFYEVMGMGQMKSSGTADGGEVTLTRSHVDQGWNQKFGKADHPLNYFTCGFITAMFGCAFDKPMRSYQVEETTSIVKGDQQSSFSVKSV